MSVNLEKLPAEAKHYRQGLLKLKENLDNFIENHPDKYSTMYLMMKGVQTLTDDMLFSGDAMSAMEQERQAKKLELPKK